MEDIIKVDSIESLVIRLNKELRCLDAIDFASRVDPYIDIKNKEKTIFSFKVAQKTKDYKIQFIKDSITYNITVKPKEGDYKVYKLDLKPEINSYKASGQELLTK